ncbi:L-2-amino-thiazoline-4-carboxylic acid hydrolase [Enterocloster asparagiformis]|uniref:L-2-amino-thiazoline-4-carboxylic acid hydrolase n=1 Tax=Enterocloster asparagiformis TaxID=333367 RepID=UPI000466A078|nr:L-2-amino-thiazoline-4-carboxylic acid hydrolase [Enterocloster asparagiformis]
MYTYEQKCVMNLGDAYTLLYGFIAGNLIGRLGKSGERAVREATRQFGYDRAETTRKRHLEVNAKINMLNLFTLFHDLPSDPRFRRELQEINPQERVSHTLVCPMADIWAEYGQKAIGRIYCEEFHPACYNHYAFDKTQVNLSKTLTQDGDEYCDFNVILRPETLPEDLKPVCFAEYDPCYREPEIPHVETDGKKGFALLSVKLYFYLLKYAALQLGEAGVQAVREGLNQFADAMGDLFLKRAAEDGLAVDRAYVRDNLPVDLDTQVDAPLWEAYGDYNARGEMQKEFCDRLAAKVGI